MVTAFPTVVEEDREVGPDDPCSSLPAAPEMPVKTRPSEESDEEARSVI